MLSANKCGDQYEELITSGYLRSVIDIKVSVNDLTYLCVMFLKTRAKDEWASNTIKKGISQIGTMTIDKSIFRKVWKLKCIEISGYRPSFIIGLLQLKSLQRNRFSTFEKDIFGLDTRQSKSVRSGYASFTHKSKWVMSYIRPPNIGDIIIIQYRTLYDDGDIRGELSFGTSQDKLNNSLVIATTYIPLDRNEKYHLTVLSEGRQVDTIMMIQ